MAITVQFSNGSKRENSTKRLTMTATHDCVFKNGCNMLNPTLLLELTTNTFPTYTAFKIENRYYNVTDIRSVRQNLFEISGEVDVLATYKDNILATKAYVVYDNTPNTEIPDNRLPMKTSVSVDKSTVEFPWEVTDGKFVLSLTGGHSSTGTYLVSASELRDLIDDIQDVTDNIFDAAAPPTAPILPASPTLNDIVTYVGQGTIFMGQMILYVIQTLFLPISQIFGTGNLPENIRECKKIPFDIGVAQFLVDPVYLGTFKTKQSLYQLSSETVYERVTVSIPWNSSTPQGDYRRRSPYTDIYLYIPYIGMIKLSSENLENQTELEITFAVAIRNGDMVCTVFSGDRKQVIGQYAGNIAVEVPIGFSNISMPQVAQSVISGVDSALRQDLGGVGLAAVRFGESITPNYTSIGGLDGMASTATLQDITCYTVFHDTIAPPNTEINTIGAPTMKPKSLANCTHYLQTKSASVEGAMTADERNKLNRLLDSGIFIE